MVFISDKKIEKIVEHFGIRNQKTKAVEELSELTLAVMHDINGKTNRENVVEEVADVYIMLKQLEEIYHIQPVELQKQVTYKVDRTMQRVERVERKIKLHGKKVKHDDSVEASN